MNLFRGSVVLSIICTLPLAYGQNPPNNAKPLPIETTVCKILDDPSAYNNKLIKVRGYVRASLEYSLLIDERCPESGIWFALADGSAPPELQITVKGSGSAGGKDSKGRPTPPISVHLVKDENFALLRHYWAMSAKRNACIDGPPPDFPPDCTAYRVTATFVGRLDGISKKVQEARRKRSNREGTDWEGFGHMRMFDAQIVVQSVENVVAVAEDEIRERKSKSH
jgi:hypothetical protein